MASPETIHLAVHRCDARICIARTYKIPPPILRHTPYGHIIHPVYPVPTLPRAPIPKDGIQNASYRMCIGNEARRGKARRCTGTCVLLAATGSELSCSGRFLEERSKIVRGYFTLGWTMVPDSRAGRGLGWTVLDLIRNRLSYFVSTQ